MTKDGLFIFGVFVGSAIVGLITHVTQPEVTSDVVVIHENVTHPLTIGYSIPWVQVVHLPDAHHETKIGASWDRFDLAVRELDRKIDALRLGELQCHTALSGWEHATTQWNAACHGVEEACR